MHHNEHLLKLAVSLAIGLLLAGAIATFGAMAVEAQTVNPFALVPRLDEPRFYRDALLNLGTELIGAFVTFMLLTVLWGTLEKQVDQETKDSKLKQQLIREMGSPDNGIALRAVEELRAQGWLVDGSLKRANLEGANLKGANLANADLTNAILWSANLEDARMTHAILAGAYLEWTNLKDADLREADLSGVSDLSDEQLRHVARLKGAYMSDLGDSEPHRYNGCFNLSGDLEEARDPWEYFGRPIPVSDDEAMARFYGVPLDDYQRGQEWARKNLSELHLEDSQEGAF